MRWSWPVWGTVVNKKLRSMTAPSAFMAISVHFSSLGTTTVLVYTREQGLFSLSGQRARSQQQLAGYCVIAGIHAHSRKNSLWIGSIPSVFPKVHTGRSGRRPVPSITHTKAQGAISDTCKPTFMPVARKYVLRHWWW